MYELQIPKLPRESGSLFYSVAAALGIMKLEPLDRSVVELAEEGQDIEKRCRRARRKRTRCGEDLL